MLLSVVQSSHLFYKSYKSYIFEKSSILSYILTKYPINPIFWQFTFHATKTRNLMSPDVVSVVRKCSKIRFQLGLCPGPHWGGSDHSSRLHRTRRNGGSWGSFHDISGPRCLWKNKTNCLFVSLINKNFTVGCGSYAVCVFMMLGARRCTGIRVEYLY